MSWNNKTFKRCPTKHHDERLGEGYFRYIDNSQICCLDCFDDLVKKHQGSCLSECLNSILVAPHGSSVMTRYFKHMSD